jgi:hypothetical protein
MPPNNAIIPTITYGVVRHRRQHSVPVSP